MNILFYSPFDQRSRDTESLMLAFQGQGHRVFSLSQAEGKYIHPYLASQGIEVHTYQLKPGNGLWYYARHFFYLLSFCNKKKIDILYSHLEPANFVAVLVQYFIHARVYICRHHINEAELYNFNRSVYYRITYAWAKNIIVVSDNARKYMIDHEGVSSGKIKHINLAYDFELFPAPSSEAIVKIEALSPGALLLVTAGRLTRHKRPALAVQVLHQLVVSGINARLIILGQGEEEMALKNLVETLKLSHRVQMPGYVQNVQDYLAAAHFLLHPSVTESSCVVVKEAALVNTPVIVCRGIGDFDEYLRHKENGFVVPAESFVQDAADVIVNFHENEVFLHQVTAALHEQVHHLFSIQAVLPAYDTLNAEA